MKALLATTASQRPDGTLEPASSVDVDEEPKTGDYLMLDDGRRVQVLGYARQEDGRLSYRVVAPPHR